MQFLPLKVSLCTVFLFKVTSLLQFTVSSTKMFSRALKFFRAKYFYVRNNQEISHYACYGKGPLWVLLRHVTWNVHVCLTHLMVNIIFCKYLSNMDFPFFSGCRKNGRNWMTSWWPLSMLLSTKMVVCRSLGKNEHGKYMAHPDVIHVYYEF